MRLPAAAAPTRWPHCVVEGNNKAAGAEALPEGPPHKYQPRLSPGSLSAKSRHGGHHLLGMGPVESKSARLITRVKVNNAKWHGQDLGIITANVWRI